MVMKGHSYGRQSTSNSMMMKMQPFVLASNFQAMHFHIKQNQWRGSGGESNRSSVDCEG